VILPVKCVEDFKSNPESALSFQQGSYDFFLGDYTGITSHERATATLVRRDVGRLLDQVYEIVQDAALTAIFDHIGACEGSSNPLRTPIMEHDVKSGEKVSNMLKDKFRMDGDGFVPKDRQNDYQNFSTRFRRGTIVPRSEMGKLYTHPVSR
jgi:hypothetical protein